MTVWTGHFTTGQDSDSVVIKGPTRDVCEARLKAIIDNHYHQHPDAPIWDAWMSTPRMSELNRDAEPKGVMTMTKLGDLRRALGRDDVEITVGGRVFR